MKWVKENVLGAADARVVRLTTRMSVSKKYIGLVPNGPLYHYTSQEGLMGILSSGAIWATHVLCLNDYTEYVHALEITKTIVESRRSGAAGSNRGYYDSVLAKVSIGRKVQAVWKPSEEREGSITDIRYFKLID